MTVGLLNPNLINFTLFLMSNFIKNSCRILIIIPILLFGFTACENDIAVVNSITSATEKQLPIESGKNVEIMYSDSARVRAKLTTPQLDRYDGKKKYMELSKGMQVIFYNEQRKEQTKLTADYGIGFDDGTGVNRMEAKRNVVVINEKGDKLNTEDLIWDAVTKKIYTDDFVKITTKDETIWGDGLTANEDFSEYEITHPKGSIVENEQDTIPKKN
jgi:LPS export ABC transporter protein LptC